MPMPWQEKKVVEEAVVVVRSSTPAAVERNRGKDPPLTSSANANLSGDCLPLKLG